jgi:hypothetical protein
LMVSMYQARAAGKGVAVSVPVERPGSWQDLGGFSG